MTHNGYAVLDFETTGLSPNYHHRVVEIGLVLVDAEGRIEREVETVLNPGRDLGPTHIHGLRGADVRDAPTFEQIADEFVELLAGRVVVAHNARFDLAFLRAELERCGLVSPIGDDGGLCTMKLASTFLPGSGRKLADCCAAFDIELSDAHEALADARATAQLLAAYLEVGREAGDWWANWGEYASALAWSRPTGRRRAPWYPRRRATSGLSDSSDASTGHLADDVPMAFLDDATNRLPPLDADPAAEAYAALLDRALSDGFLSVGEADELSGLAESLGIDVFRRTDLHEQYFAALVEAVWSDGFLTPSEIAQVDAVATMLDIAPDQRSRALVPREAPRRLASEQARQDPAAAPFDLGSSDVVVITGELWAPRESVEAILRERGVGVGAGVTKKTTLLVAADPDSLSGKARKARQYGIPIVGGEALREMLALV